MSSSNGQNLGRWGDYESKNFMRLVTDTYRLIFETIKRFDTVKSFVLFPRRWVVE
jgi:hypothetical protein